MFGFCDYHSPDCRGFRSRRLYSLLNCSSTTHRAHRLPLSLKPRLVAKRKLQHQADHCTSWSQQRTFDFLTASSSSHQHLRKPAFNYSPSTHPTIPPIVVSRPSFNSRRERPTVATTVIRVFLRASQKGAINTRDLSIRHRP